MVVLCGTCQQYYDDAECGTICPHESFSYPAVRITGAVEYCREHDLFNCHLPHASRVTILPSPETKPLQWADAANRLMTLAADADVLQQTPPTWWKRWLYRTAVRVAAWCCQR